MSRQNPLSKIKPINDEQLLVTRDQVRLMLGGISYITVVRLEEQGKLRSVRLTSGNTAKRYYRRVDVVMIASTYFGDSQTVPISPQST